MFDWLRRLVPQSGDFFDLFERHARSMIGAAELLSEMMRGDGDRIEKIAAIRDREHEADDVIREVLQEVRQTFLTPFDRGVITALINEMDDTIDEIQSCASAVETYDFAKFSPDMIEMGDKILVGVRKVEEALPLLRDVKRNGKRLHQLTSEIVSIEGEIDVIHTRGLKANYSHARATADTVDFIVVREIFKHLEKIADALEDVANQIDGIVIDYA